MDRRDFLGLGTIAGYLATIDPIEAARRRAKSSRSSSRKAAPRRPAGPQNFVDKEGRLHIFFTTADWQVSRNDLDHISAYLRDPKSRNAESWLVEGHCDERGTNGYNIWLGQQRANAVAHYLRGGRARRIETVSYGEDRPLAQGSSRRDYALNRCAVVIRNVSPLAAGIRANLKADALVIDASGSMNGEGWATVMRQTYNPRTHLYAFNECVGVKPINRFSDINPDCGTPLWDAGQRVVESHNYREIALITDGGNNVGSLTPDSLIAAAKRRGTKINIVGAGHYSIEQLCEMARVADETGGKHYLNMTGVSLPKNPCVSR